MTFESLRSTQGWEARLGEQVRELRHARGLTQAVLAQRANVSLSAVKYLEKGKGSSLSTLIRIVRVLERTEWLSSLAPPTPAVRPLDLLRERQSASALTRRRVRSRPPTEPSP